MVNADGTPNDDELAQIEAMEKEIANIESQRTQKNSSKQVAGFGSIDNTPNQSNNRKVDDDVFSDTD